MPQGIRPILYLIHTNDIDPGNVLSLYADGYMHQSSAFNWIHAEKDERSDVVANQVEDSNKHGQEQRQLQPDEEPLPESHPQRTANSIMEDIGQVPRSPSSKKGSTSRHTAKSREATAGEESSLLSLEGVNRSRLR